MVYLWELYRSQVLARTRRYKKLEKNVVSHLMHLCGSFFEKVGQFFVRAFKFCDSKLTIMIVPHSEGKVLNIQTNIFAMILSVVVVVGVTVSFIYFNHKTAGSTQEISRLKEENRETLASLDELRDENNNLLQTAKRFQSSLSQSLSLLGINQNTSVSNNTPTNKDLSSLFDSQDITSGSLKESADIRQLNDYLESSVQPVEQMGKMLQSQGSLFSDIPNIWPLKNGIGHVSMAFGQNQHPVYGYWYIHKGMDFSTYRTGDPIIATANGQVVTVGSDLSFGNYVIIKHKHGIYTRYAHMNSVWVHKGDMVSQRQVIGTIGGLTGATATGDNIVLNNDVTAQGIYETAKNL